MNRCRVGLLSVIFVAVVGCAMTPPMKQGEGQLAIVGVTVVNPERDGAAATMADATVVISGERIVAVGPRASTAVPAGAVRIDGKDKWLIPGLIDGHVHFFQSGNLYTRPDGADFNAVVPYAQEVARNKARLPATFKVWLASGVTSVIDIGGPFWNFDMRDSAAKTAAAPRVEVAGPLISMVDRRSSRSNRPRPRVRSSRANWNASRISSRFGSSISPATIWQNRRRSSRQPVTRRTRRICAWPCTRPSSTSPRLRCVPAPTIWCIRCLPSRSTMSSSP